MNSLSKILTLVLVAFFMNDTFFILNNGLLVTIVELFMRQKTMVNHVQMIIKRS